MSLPAATCADIAQISGQLNGQGGIRLRQIFGRHKGHITAMVLDEPPSSFMGSSSKTRWNPTKEWSLWRRPLGM